MSQKMFIVSSKIVKIGGPWGLARALCTFGASRVEQNKKVSPEEVHYRLQTHRIINYRMIKTHKASQHCHSWAKAAKLKAPSFGIAVARILGRQIFTATMLQRSCV